MSEFTKREEAIDRLFQSRGVGDGQPKAELSRLQEIEEEVASQELAREVRQNQPGLREQVSGQFGTPTALPTADVGFRTEADVFRATEPGVDIKNPAFEEDSGLTDLEGNPVGPSFAATLAFNKGSNREALLDRTFGPEGYRLSKDNRIIIRMPDGSERLADNFGFSSADFFDLADEGVEVAGGIAAIAAAPATAGAFALAALGALGSQAGVTVGEILATIGNDNSKEFVGIAKRRGTAAAMDFMFGLFPAGIVSARALKLRQEVGEEGLKGMDKMTSRLRRLTEVEVPISAGARLGSETLQRGEAIASKLPFSAERMKKLINEQEAALQEAQRRSVGESNLDQEDLVDILNRQAGKAEADVERAASQLDFLVQRDLEEIGNILSREGGRLTPSDAGRISRVQAARERNVFKATDNLLYGQYRELAGDQKVVAAARFRDLGDRLRTALPKDAETGKVSDSFLNAESKRFLKGLRTVGDMTVDEARNARRIVDDLISKGTVAPSVDTQVLMDVRSELTGSLRDAVKLLPDDAADLLRAANKHHSDNIDKFLAPGVREMFVPITERGFKENSEIFENLLFGPPERLQRMIGSGPNFGILDIDGRRAFGRAAFNEMLRRSKPNNAPDNVNAIDPARLAQMLDGFDSQALRDLFDPARTGQGDQILADFRELVNAVKIRHGKIELEDGLDLSGNLRKQLLDAVEKEKAFAKEFKSDVIGPFIRNEIGVAQLKPNEFSRHVMSLPMRDVQRVMARLRREGADDEFRKNVLRDIYSRSEKPAKQNDAIEGLIEPGQPRIDGEALATSIESMGRDKLRTVVGNDAMSVLDAISAIRIGVSDQAASQAGGLISGGLISGLMVNAAATLPIIGQFRLFAALAANQRFGKALARLRGIETASKGEAPEIASAVVMGQVAEDVLSEFNDDPTLREAVRKVLNNSFDVDVDSSFESKQESVDALFRNRGL